MPGRVRGPVDTPAPRPHPAAVSKKPSKVEETSTPYPAKKPAKRAAPTPKPEGAGVRYMDEAAFKQASEKVFKVHNELFRKLAQ